MKGTAKEEVLEEAARLGVRPEVVEALKVNLTEIDFQDELHGVGVLPTLEEALDEDYPLAAAVVTVRLQRGAELESARPIVEKADLARQKRQQGAEKSRLKREKKALSRVQKLSRWIDRQGKTATAGNIWRKLTLEGEQGDKFRVAALGGKRKAVPSLDTIERLLKEKAGE